MTSADTRDKEKKRRVAKESNEIMQLPIRLNQNSTMTKTLALQNLNKSRSVYVTNVGCVKCV